MEKPVRLIAGAVFLLLLLAPFRSCQWNSFYLPESEVEVSDVLSRSLEEEAKQQVMEQWEEGLRNFAEQVLSEEGIIPIKIEIFMDTSNAVSYTHLDVYKRQLPLLGDRT